MVYRVWQELRYYLELFDARTSIAVRNIDEIYEIWCFLELRNILMDELGFSEKQRKAAKPRRSETGLERDDGETSSFLFERADGIEVQLQHEPRFSADIGRGRHAVKVPIRTYRLVHKPDILLRATFADGRECIWLFDAKYRLASIANDESTDTDTDDLVPDDALHQMHRYRDALIREDTAEGSGFST